MPGEKMSGEWADDSRLDSRRIRFAKRIRLVGEKHDVRPQIENFRQIDRRIALAIAQQVASANALDEIRDVRIAAAPHPRLFPDGDDEREFRARLAAGVQLLDEIRGPRLAVMRRAKISDEFRYVVDRPGLGSDHTRKFRNLVCMLLQI